MSRDRGYAFALVLILWVGMSCLSAGFTVHAAKKSSSSKKEAVKIEEISWKKYSETLTIKKGEKKRLKVVYLPKNASNKQLKWKTSNKKIVSVTENGTITGKKKGKATITVKTVDGTKKKLKLSVTVGVKAESVSFGNINEMGQLYVGNTYGIQAVVFPENTSNPKLVWLSSDDTVATVDDNGMVQGIGNGVVTITARTTDGTDKETSVTFEVRSLVTSLSLALKKKTAYCVPVNGKGVVTKKGNAFTIKPTFKPEDASDQGLIWTSSNPLVAAVDDYGNVTPVDAGFATITATTVDGSDKSATFTVSVGDYTTEDCEFIAHRGFSELAPANSLAAFRLAMEAGFSYVEFDIWNTVDQEFAVSHDNSLKAMCGVDANVTDLTLEQAMSFHIISGNELENYPNEYIASLEQVLSLAVPYTNTKLAIEIKPELSGEMLQKLLRLIAQYGMSERVQILSLHQSNLAQIRTMKELGGEDIRLCYLTKTTDSVAMQVCVSYKADLGVRYTVITHNMVRTMHENGLKVNVWTVPDYNTACFMIGTLGVDAVTTNYQFFQ